MESTNGLKRTHYFHGQFLSAEDFEREQTYFREKMRRLHQALFGLGVVEGLEVGSEDDCGDRTLAPAVNVSPGYAVGPDGNEIVLDEPLRLPLDFKGAKRVVAIRYDERLVDPVPGGEEAAEFRAVEEVAIVDALEALPTSGDDGWVVLADVEVGADGEVRVDTSSRQLAAKSCGEAQ